MYRKYIDVAAVACVVILGLISIIQQFPSLLMIGLGLALFVAPGYVWSEIITTSKSTKVEKFVIGSGLALMVPIFGGLILFALSIPLRRSSWIGVLAVAAVAGATILTFRRWDSETKESRRRRSSIGKISVDSVVAFGVAAAIAAGAVALAMVSADLQKYAGYTQLWMSPQPGKMRSAQLGVTNQQDRTVQYRLVLLRRGRVSTSWNLTLSEGQSWRHTVEFTYKYPIEADLYKLPNLHQPYRRVGNIG